ncbi:MAG: hypothetical protein H7067_03820 [Burkholderiales bacterium]|nr:hypothetical protein [Opitutaceae bacterium]
MRLILSLGTLLVLLITGFFLILGSALGLRPARIQKANTHGASRPSLLARLTRLTRLAHA